VNTARTHDDRTVGTAAVDEVISDRYMTLRVAPMKRALAAEREVCDQLAQALRQVEGIMSFDALEALAAHARLREVGR